jgi:hypothetical protein
MSTVTPQPQPQLQPQAQPPLPPQPQPQPQTQPPVQPQARPETWNDLEKRESIRIYSHSPFFYWWPVWVAGYVMAAVTWLGGEPVQFGGMVELVHPSQIPGVVFTVVLFGVILFTNVALRGLASVVAIVTALFLIVLLAYLDIWDDILSWLPQLSVHMNLGFYLFFSTLVFVVWGLATFVYDRMSYYEIRPGQITGERVIGGAERSYDTHGMVFEKERQDMFRHWILGLGSGDLHIHTMGAKRENLHIPNVLFVDWKVDAIQKLISTRPNDFSAPAIS